MDFEKIIAKIRSGKTWRFHGGIHPAEHKDESSETPVERLEPASVYIVPVRQHSGDAGTIVVKAGDYVRKGDLLTRSSGRRDLPVSAPTSGTIAKIGLHTAPHQSGLEDIEITITPDGKDEWRERHPIADFRTKSPEELLSVIHNAGIAGMGGAGFPADQIIAGAVGKTHILIINGSECEPYITCDDRLMREKAEEIVEGIRILKYILKPEVAIIAIEDNKQEAAKAIKDAVREDDDIIVRVLETRYPTGAARPLIRRLTGIEVGYTSRSTDFGIEMQNVATTYAIKRAVEDDEPLVERIVTVTGNNFGRCGNFIVPFGTPVRHILDKCEWHGEARNELILGGPMMGFTVPTPDVSVTKTINCVFSPDSTEVMSYDNPLECIRCGRCARVCPSRLLPFALVKAAKAGDSEAIQRERIRDCIECGCCAFVCPSRIPLVRYIRIAKARLREEAAEARKKQNTERLIAEKLSREEKIAAARKARIAALKEGAAPKPATASSATLSPATSGAAAAADSPAQAVNSSESAAKPKSAALPAALARAKAARAKSGAALQGGNLSGASGLDAGAAAKPDVPAAAGAASGNASSENSAAGSARSKALAAALARAKAKKAAESVSAGASESQAQKQDAPEPEPKPAANAKSAAVAAALAKARARKMAEAAGGDSGKTEPNKAADGQGASAAASGANPKKAAVAAALAKARARKAAESGAAAESAGNSQENNAQSADAKAPADAQKSADESSADPKKAALAAALARAKARKQAEAASHEADNAAEKPARSEGAEESPQSSGSSARAPAADPRKAAVAAALARARAKKQPAAALSSSQDKAESGDKESPSEENK